MKNRPFHVRLGYALNGIRSAFETERSFRFQVFSAGLVLIFILLVRPGALASALLVLCVGVVLSAELFNTALEKLTDHLHPELHPSIRLVKDCAAGAVLVASVAAVIVFLFTLFSLM